MADRAFCFAYTPFHAYFLEQMDFSAYQKVYLLNFSRKKINLSTAKRTVNLINSTQGFWRVMQFFGVLLKSWFYFQLEKDLFLPHAHHEVANTFFFSQATRNRYLIQDGIANYYDAMLHQRFRKKIVRRLRVLRFFGYQDYRPSDDFFCSDWLDKVFVFFPSYLTQSLLSKGVVVSPVSLSVDNRGGELLFLDQPVGDFLTDKQQAALLPKIVHLFECYAKIYCKTHHDGVSSICSQLRAQVIEEPNWNQLTAEELFACLMSGVVASFVSSALINIRAMSQDVRVVAYVPADKTIKRDGEEMLMSDFFKLFSVEVVIC